MMAINLTGCWDQKIYERSGFIMQVGVDEGKGNKLLMTYTAPVVDPNASEQIEIMYSPANSLRDFRQHMRRISPRMMEGGKIQQIVISDSVAQKGINEILEVMEREAANPSTAYVVIVEGSANILLNKAQSFSDKPLVAYYIHKLIDNTAKESYVPSMRIAEFSTLYFSPGVDPIAPMIKLEYQYGKGIEAIGSALFSKDKMVGKINPEETSLLLAMMGKMNKTTLILRSLDPTEIGGEKKSTAISVGKPKRKIEVKIVNDKAVVNINLKFKGTINEYKWNRYYDEAIQRDIEKRAASELKEQCDNIIKYIQKVGSDPIGVGDIVRAKHNAYWKKVDWNKAYKEAVFNVKVDMSIVRHGVIK